jgi:hypothetical protein
MKTDTSFTPENLKLWTLPSSYFGEEWNEHYRFLGQNRDSDALARSNFRSALAAIGGEKTIETEDEDDPAALAVTVVRESHWACGWVEWVAIHKDNVEALRKADEIMGGLDDYPVVDEHDYSELEQDDANLTWKNCYSEKERVAYIREHEGQFEFRDFADMIGCVRGNYFAGYASELLA